MLNVSAPGTFFVSSGQGIVRDRVVCGFFLLVVCGTILHFAYDVFGDDV